MIQKYLTNNPIPYLQKDQDIIIKYLTSRDILDKHNNEELYQQLIKQLTASNKLPNNILGDINNFDIISTGTYWKFAELIEYGLNISTPQITNTSNYIINNYQDKSGGFYINTSPMVIDARITGSILYYLIKANVQNLHIKKGIEWILKNQRHDGGWLYKSVYSSFDHCMIALFNKPGKGLRHENRSCIASCPHSTLSCAFALLIYNNTIETSVELQNAIRDAVTYIIDSLQNINNFKLYYSYMNTYSCLSSLYFLSCAKKLNDNRVSAIFNGIMKKQNNQGLWLKETKHKIFLERVDAIKLNNNDPWLTLQILRIMKNAELLAF